MLREMECPLNEKQKCRFEQKNCVLIFKYKKRNIWLRMTYWLIRRNDRYLGISDTKNKTDTKTK